ncbi:MAG: long-chain-fatty-acid--CoA ligase [Acidobacteriota bacterium]
MIHADLLTERARLTPDKEALVEVASGSRWTYRQLNDRATRVAALWRRLGLEKGDRVGILAHNRVEFLDAFFAAPKGGVVLVTLGTRLTAHELAHVVADAGCRALIYDGDFADTIAAMRDQVPTVEHWLALDAPSDAPADSTDLAWATEIESVESVGFTREPCVGDDLYCLLYTSGTTGKPKGVMIPHRMVAWNGYNTACGWGLREDDVSPIFTPLYHAGGLMAFLVPIFTVGGTIVLHDGFDTDQVWDVIERERCTVILGVPTIWQMLMESPRFATADLSSVRWLISGGAPLPQYLIDVWQGRGAAFKQGFGMTEVGVNCFAMTVEDSVAKAGSIGKPMMFTDVRLVDETGADVATGEVGEMLFRGPHVSLGYWNNEAATQAAHDADGFFHSGDLARRDADGFFYVAGREKDMIISGGVNVYPAEIEGELMRHPAVADAAVVGVPDEKWGEIGVAFVVAREALDDDALTSHLEARLARYKLPRGYRYVDALPRTPYGKVVKGELRERFVMEAAS